MRKILIICNIGLIIPLFSTEKSPFPIRPNTVPNIQNPLSGQGRGSYPQLAFDSSVYNYNITPQSQPNSNSTVYPSSNDDGLEPLPFPPTNNPFSAILDAHFYNTILYYTLHHEAQVKHIIEAINFNELKSLNDDAIQRLCDYLIVFTEGINHHAFDKQCIHGFIAWLQKTYGLSIYLNNSASIPNSNYSPTIIYTTLFENSDIMKAINRSFARHLQASQLEAIQQLVNRMTGYIHNLIQNTEPLKENISGTKSSTNLATILAYESKIDTFKRAIDILQRDVQGYIWRAQHPYLAHFSFLPIWQKYGLAAAGACAAYFCYKWIFPKSETMPLYDPNHQYTYDRTKNEKKQ